MEARLLRVAIMATALVSLGAGYRTPNFVVNAPTPEMARGIGDAAERFREELAIEWLGKPLPNWSRPCPITAQVSPQLGAGGATSFVFDQGQVFGWQMSIQGSYERILDSVLPHEVTHTVFATHFRQPLPRWADEGACTTTEADSERARQQQMLINFLKTGRGIPFAKMFAMKEYPRDVLPLYAQGHSLASYLIAQGGKRKFIEFVGDGLREERWPETIKKHYGFDDLGVLQETWLAWVRQGSPALTPENNPAILLASTRQPSTDKVTPATYATPADAPNTTPATFAAAPPAANTVAVAAAHNPDESYYLRARGWRPAGSAERPTSPAEAGATDGVYISQGDHAIRVGPKAERGAFSRLEPTAPAMPSQVTRPPAPQSTQLRVLEHNGSGNTTWR